MGRSIVSTELFTGMTQPSNLKNIKMPKFAVMGGENPFPNNFPEREWVWEYLQKDVAERVEIKARAEKFRLATEDWDDDEPSGHWTDDSDDRLNNGGEPWNDPNEKDDEEIPEDFLRAAEIRKALTREQQTFWSHIRHELEYKAPSKRFPDYLEFIK